MKKIILVIVFILGFNNAALSLSWDRIENRTNVKLPGNVYGYSIGEGHWGSKLEEFPNCKRFNEFPGKGLRQGNKTRHGVAQRQRGPVARRPQPAFLGNNQAGDRGRVERQHR